MTPNSIDDYEFDNAIINLKRVIRERMQMAANQIVEEEIQNVLGRVKILRSQNLKDDVFHWCIAREGE